MPDTGEKAIASKRRRLAPGLEEKGARGKVQQIFAPFRAIGIVANQVPPAVHVRGKAYHVTTCVAKSFHTYDCSKLNLLFVGGETDEPIQAVETAGDYVFVAARSQISGYRRGKLALKLPEVEGRVTRLLHLSTMMLAITASPPQLHVFHIPEEKLIGSLDLGEGGDATAILHPTTWLNKIILGRESGVVQIWNIRTGKLIYETQSFGSAVTCLAQSPALDVIGIGLHSGTIHIRNLRMDTEIQTFSQPQAIHSLTFRTDGPPLLASSSSTGRLSIFDLNKRRVVHTLETSSTNQPVNIIFLPNQPILLTTSRDNSIKLFVFEDSGPRLLKSRTGHSAPPTALHTHSAKWLLSSAAGSLRGQSLFNDSQSFEFSQTALMEGYQKQAAGQGYAAANIADVVAIGSSATREEEWDAVITASRGERGARSWSWKRRTVGSHLFYTGDKSAVTAAAVSYCGNFGVVGSERGNIEVFNMQSGIKRKQYPPATKWAYAQLWDFKTCAIKGRVDVASAITVGRLQGGLLAVSCDDLSIRVVDHETPGGRVVRELWGHSNRITDFVFSPTSNWIISVSLDSTLRVWDLPTGFLISAVILPAIATAIAFSPSEEFLATAHVGSLGIHLWSNRSQFRNIPVRRVSEEDIPALQDSLPSIAGTEGEGILEGAFDLDEQDDEDVTRISTADQLADHLLTLSLQPRAKMWSLLNLEAIRRRNRAKEPIQQPEKAPFFLPSLNDATKTRQGIDQPAPTPQSSTEPKSRIFRFEDRPSQSEFTTLLHSTDAEALVKHLASLSPSQLDYSLRTMSLLAPFTEPLNFVRNLTAHLRTKRDFEMVQAWMLSFLRIQQDWLVQVRDEEQVREVMREWEEVHRGERERTGELVGYVGGVLGFIRGI